MADSGTPCSPLPAEIATMSRTRFPLVLAGFALGVAATAFVTGLHGQPAPPPPAVPKELASFRDVVKRVLPAVVSIDAKSLDKKPADAGVKKSQLPPGTPDEFRRFFEVADDSGPKADPNLGFGSGVIVDPAGVVLTNFHVVEGADTVELSLQDGRKFTSKDIRRDAKTDLAVIRVQAANPLPALDLGDSDGMEVGDRVLAVGAPFGLAGSVTHGIVSAKSRQNLKLNQYEDFLQTDAAINPGNSGGPLVSLDGKVIGITSAIKTRSGGSQGVGLAVSSNLAKDVVDQLLKNGVVRRGYLGVAIKPLDDETALKSGLPKGTGVVVTKVYENTPAAKAGLQVGDIVTSVGGVAVKEANTLPRIAAKLPLDKETELVYVRDGKAVAVAVTIAEQPDDFGKRAKTVPEKPQTLKFDDLGLTVADLTPGEAARFEYPKGTAGVLVVGLQRGGPAAEAGVVLGRVIQKVDKTPVTTAKEFADALAAANRERGALLTLLRPTGEVEFAVVKVR